MPDIQEGERKTCRVCYPFVGESVGGAQVSTATLIRALPAGIHPLVVVHHDGPLGPYLEAQGIACRYLPLSQIPGQHTSPLRQIWALATASPLLVKFLRSERIDIVHTQDGRMHVGWGAAARLTRTAHVWHQRSHYKPSRIVDFFLRRAEAVIAISDAARVTLPATQAARARVVYNPVAPPSCGRGSDLARREMLQMASMSGLGDDANPLIVASVGNLRDVKQPMLLARAVSEMALGTAGPVLLALFGDDREGFVPRMAKVVDAAGDRARLIHFGFRHPIEDWLSGCDLLLATSNGDAFGRTLVEAMAVGVPVVAVGAGGHREIVTNGVDGVLVADQDPKALAVAALAIAGDNNLRKRLVAEGRKRVKSFTPNRHAAAVTAVYRDLQGRA